MPNVDDIIHELCIKRLFLPHDADINDLKDHAIPTIFGLNHTDRFCHIACVFKGELMDKNILGIGSNCFKNNNLCLPSIHAEINAIDKIKTNYETKKLQPINLLIIRVNKLGEIKMSKPCKNCIDRLLDFPCKKGYKVKQIIYSLDDGNFEFTTLNKLHNSKDYHVTKFFRTSCQETVS
jgi:cytidine deaminase